MDRISVDESVSGSLDIETSSTVVWASNIFSVVTIFSNSGSIDSPVSSTVFESAVINTVSSTFFVVDSFVGSFCTSVTITVLVSVAGSVTGLIETWVVVVVKPSDSVISLISSSVNKLGSTVVSVSISAPIIELATLSVIVVGVVEAGVELIRLDVEIVISSPLSVTARVVSAFIKVAKTY